MKKLLGILVLGLLLSTNAHSACKKEDFIKYVEVKGNCIALFGTKKNEINKKQLIILLHGDHRKRDIGGNLPAFVNKIENKDRNVFVIARPGWKVKNRKSDGGDSRGVDRGDNYIFIRDIEPVALAIKKLKEHYKPEELILFGYSGGAALTGVIIGKYSGLIDHAILAGCPCNVPEWRKHRRKGSGWPRSSSPHKHVSTIDKDIKVDILIGKNDKNTHPKFSEQYYDLLKKENIDVTLTSFNGDHATMWEKPIKIINLIKKAIES